MLRASYSPIPVRLMISISSENTCQDVHFAIASESSEVGKFIQLPYNNRISPCCWGNQTNHMGKDGQRIGQYSIPLD